MPASLFVAASLLFIATQPPDDGGSSLFPGQDPPADAAPIAPFGDLSDPAPPATDAPAINPGEDLFADPPAPAPAPPPLIKDPFATPEAPPVVPGGAPGEPSVGLPMQDVDDGPGVLVEPDDVPLNDPAFPVNPLLESPEAPLPLDPTRPDVVVIDDPAVTVITQPNPLAELIRNPYDIYDLREHVATPADCLLARQACLPQTICVTTCGPCGGTTSSLPVPGVNPFAAEQIAQILLARTPADPRLNYLMFVLRNREGRYEEMHDFLERAVRLEIANPDAFRDYGEFMTPIQGRSRVYLERVRRLAGLGVI